jgi:hypothetical protein
MTTPSAAAVAKAKELHPTWYGSDKSLYDYALALDAYAREHAHWRCDLCHCCGEKRHDGGDPCVSCDSTAREHTQTLQYQIDELRLQLQAAQQDARQAREREAAVWEEAARIVDGFVEPMTHDVAVDTGRMWRSGQALNIAKALRDRAAAERRTGE